MTVKSLAIPKLNGHGLASDGTVRQRGIHPVPVVQPRDCQSRVRCADANLERQPAVQTRFGFPRLCSVLEGGASRDLLCLDARRHVGRGRDGDGHSQEDGGSATTLRDASGDAHACGKGFERIYAQRSFRHLGWGGPSGCGLLPALTEGDVPFGCGRRDFSDVCRRSLPERRFGGLGLGRRVWVVFAKVLRGGVANRGVPMVSSLAQPRSVVASGG